MYMAPAWWSESASTSLEDPSSFTAVTREDPSGHNGGGRGSEELPAPAHSAWQSCLPVVGLMILTSLLLGTAVTTVLRMNDILAAPADGTQVTPHTARDVSGLSEVETMMTPRRLLLQPTIAAVRPRATFRRAHHKAGLEGDSGREVGTGKSSFESASAVHARPRGKHRSHLVRRASMTKPENATSPPSNIKTTLPGCQEPSHTYCTGSDPEYFYSSLADACVLASENVVQLCNRGRNKFSSKRRCEMHCVRAEHPHLDCLEKPQFTACRRDDMKLSPWYFNGKRCTPWDFPSGRCPSNDSLVFTTASDCATRCSDPRFVACSLPRPVDCEHEQQRFPYFAVHSPEGVRCLSASAAELRGHLCMDGLNRFNTSQACEDACRNTTT